nr:hypothetical protein [Burkholderia sp. Nafp2/4-1b]
MTYQTLTQLKSLKLDGMACALEEQAALIASTGLSFYEHIEYRQSRGSGKPRVTKQKDTLPSTALPIYVRRTATRVARVGDTWQRSRIWRVGASSAGLCRSGSTRIWSARRCAALAGNASRHRDRCCTAIAAVDGHHAYRKLAATFKMSVSMSRRANTATQSPFKTLKAEKISQTDQKRAPALALISSIESRTSTIGDA